MDVHTLEELNASLKGRTLNLSSFLCLANWSLNIMSFSKRIWIARGFIAYRPVSRSLIPPNELTRFGGILCNVS
jgi:hypothetical protein